MRNKYFTSLPLAGLCASLILSSCGDRQDSPAQPNLEVTKEVYGVINGREVTKYTMVNKHGMRAVVMEYGATLVSLEALDRDGKLADITLGYDSLKGWLSNTSYFGSTVGRYGNRIAEGKFSLAGKEYLLAKNNDPGGIECHLHGGKVGFDKVLWNASVTQKPGAQGVTFSYRSLDGEEGYPGNLDIKVTYWLTDENELIWEAEATSDQETPVNLVHHSYWNLTGDPSKPITDHTLKLEAEQYLPTTIGLIPTGKRKSVISTPMDFTSEQRIGSRINDDYQALKFGGGYDHCWVLRGGQGVALAATLYDAKSGRKMEIFTDQPGIQFYSGNFLDGAVRGKGGMKYQHRTGLCLETQKFPDGPNQPSFPNSVIQPGETYKHTMIHKFSIGQ